ncbi:MAG TPA: valine--tRNA ligase [Phycisphaerae bacterium]|nr:valine--tRNA ligase [Phycisphaerae bacterium]
MTALDHLPPTYDPRSVEPRIRKLWEDGRYFRAEPANDNRPAYTIVIPPPNVTGALHGGHALNNTLQDILIRWHRMCGHNTLWMPGTDHAGIATQAVVERTIFEKEKKTRHALGRDELVKRIWDWKEQYGNRIIEQLKLMGCSCDWERTRFTLDEICARAVRHTFFRLFKDGLIVRGKRLVNWDTHLQTAVADDEVYHETVKGHFYHFKYPVKNPRPGEPEFVHIATTRPETMLGDTAVAVHPEPDRALDKAEADLKQQLADAPDKEKPAIQATLDDLAERKRTMLPTLLKLRDMARDGRKLNLPLVDREIPLIRDVWAKPELGSGCVKITPAHDANDYEVGQRHKLPMVNVLAPDGKVAKIVEPDGSVNPNSPEYEGLRFATNARKKVVADLEESGLVEKIEDRTIDIGHSDRSKTPIEPFLSDQWFVRMGDLTSEESKKVEGLRGSSGLAQLAMDMVCEKPHASAEDRKACGKVHFFPERYAKTYLDWLGEKRDWCISRQLWWGHQIPVWSTDIFPLGDNQATLDSRHWLDLRLKSQHVDAFTDEQRKAIDTQVRPVVGALKLLVCVDAGHPEIEQVLEKIGFVRDPDVLDTWFSSALWPHSTLGWPVDSPELRTYYPGDVLSTAREIITLWVARMVLTGMYNIGKVPFHDVYIHAVIQDGQGRPFKKTLGNGFDPVDIIEVYGADALRYTMASITTETQDIRMPMKRVKLDDGREVQSSEKFELGRNFCNKVWNAARFAFMNLEGVTISQIDPKALPIEDRWILSQVSRAAREVQDAMAGFQFGRAVTLARDFFWDSLCDWYLEMVKSRVREDRQAAEARQVLSFALDQSLRLLHPFIPYITERLWTQLNEIAPQRGLPGLAEPDCGQPLIISQYPPAEGWSKLDDPSAGAVFDDLQTATRAVRDIRQSRNVPPKQAVDVVIKAPADRVASLRREADIVRHLANVGSLTVDADPPKPRNSATLVLGDLQIYVAEVIDSAAEKARLEKELANLDKQIAALAGKLGNESFTGRAPADVVQREQQRLAEFRDKRETVVRTMRELT